MRRSSYLGFIEFFPAIAKTRCVFIYNLLYLNQLGVWVLGRLINIYHWLFSRKLNYSGCINLI
ncbi:MAG: hypothetical protein EBY38_09730 [Flavobacteriaceae bacterium]|nr:hypothetical protein [Flavobacteriaceae bacterium]